MQIHPTALLGNRLPPRHAIGAVYGVIVGLLYGWSFYQFLWSLPAWMLFQNASEITTVLLYALAIDLVESLLVLAMLLILGMLLPAAWLRTDFPFTGSLAAAGFLGLLMYVASQGATPERLRVLAWAPLSVVGLRLAAQRFPRLRSVVVDIAERTVVFLYLTVPASLIAAVVVGVRNAF